MPTNGTSPQHEPRVVTIRVRHRVASAAGAAMVLAMLPFLGGSVPAPHDSVVLAAGAPRAAAPQAQAGSADGVDSWRGPAAAGGGAAAGLVAAQTTAAVAGTIQQVAAGAGTFLFPALDLVTNEAVIAMSMRAGEVGLSWPLHGPEASGFGPRIHPVLGRPMFHTGIDLMAACGTPIRAAADGQVVYAAITPSWGRRVIIRHTGSLETGYAHMSQFLVEDGDVVKRGQVIGLVGTTGWSTGCHLHFDVIVNGHYVDPAPYLGLPGTSTAEVPFHASPGVAADAPGTPASPVEDGDVPVSAAVPASTTTPVAPKPKPRVTTSTPSTTSTGTPTTGTGSSTTSQPPATTTSEPPTTTTSEPPTTTTSTPPPSTTSEPPPATTTTSEPPPAATTSEPPPATTTSEPAPTTTSAAPESTTATPTASATAAATSSATETVAATTEAVLEETAAAG